ncbi:CAF17-like 4Fe-4S cluster assembly/insertion protein YgfZ [Kineobactrum salinum]|uniref:Folate-binding protein YgfZ n=1 Tax=Kineobactrum salinum TaxID=2708301 RepID=A0A6C0TXH4_9GAMM|nr:folate-binding protein YgfZ [Kineobactrum salinum]QIB64491.1 folate-binding protein YgfZ [Kineobactrum salinum]
MPASYIAPAAEALLHVTGSDALDFLQNQTSCDLRELETGRACYGVYCTPQGRVVCDFLALQAAPDHLILRLRHDILEQTVSTLARFAMFSKVNLQPQLDHWQLLVCWGERAGPALAALYPQLPAGALDCVSQDGALLVQLDASGSRFECLIDNRAQPQLAQQLAGQLAAGDETEWHALTLQDGIARIEAATVAQFLPEQLNYDLTGHINFRKGCYPGQEVIARMHYRGKAKRRMLLMQLPAGALPAAGAPLYHQGGERVVGNIVNSAATGTGTLALVTTTRAGVDGDLRLAPDASAPPLQQLSLPYPVELE